MEKPNTKSSNLLDQSGLSNEPAPLKPKLPVEQKSKFFYTNYGKMIITAILMFLIFLIAALIVIQTEKYKQTPQLSPPGTPTPTSSIKDDGLNWNTYRNDNLIFKFPPTWTENSEIPTGSGFIQEFNDSEGRFAFTFLSAGNYNQITGKPYKSLDDYINMPYTVKIIQVGGQEARQPLPRAGSENVNSVRLFSKGNQSIYTIELKTGNTSLDTSELEVQEGQKIFNQILSSFKFIENIELYCGENNGIWIEDHQVCEKINESVCLEKGGEFEECSYSFLCDSDKEDCPDVCTQACFFE